VAIKRGVHRGVVVALAMAQAATDVELQDVEGFPMGEGLGDYEDLLEGFETAANVVATLVLATRSSTRTCRLSLGPLSSPKNIKELFI
jgi:hypothetical protein